MSLDLLPPEALEARALVEARRTLDALLDAELGLVAGPGQSEWQPTQRRQVHRQAITVYRRFDEVELVVDAAGRPLRFLSRERLAAPVGDAQLSPDEQLAIARTSGLLDESAQITASDTRRLVALTITQDRAPRLLRFLLHPALRLIAAFTVVDAGGDAP